MKSIASGIVLVLALTGSALAGGNSERAKGMAEVLSSDPGIGGAAKLVSGKDPALGTGFSASGWGNTGSEVLADGSITEGAKAQGDE